MTRPPIAALALLAAAASAHAAPELDGRLDDAFWRDAAVLSAFTQVAPKAGAAPSARTELRLKTEDGVLYIGVRALQPPGVPITARTLLRDAYGVQGDDHVVVVLDPRGSGANGYYLRINAAGARGDGLVVDGDEADAAWDPRWQVVVAANNAAKDTAKDTADGAAEGHATEDHPGWTAEAAIGLAQLGGSDQPWRINAERFLAATGERLRLYGADPDRDVYALVLAQPLTSLAPVVSGLGLQVAPNVRLVHAGGNRVQAGLDAVWAFTPGAAATLTLNTDFSDAALDDRVVSLNRFELFRPEKRRFFTQDAGRFTFGGLGGDDTTLLPFFSRRVALGQTLDAGLKLSGSAGPLEFGALAVQVAQGDAPRAPRLAVVRVAGQTLPGLRLGVIATHGRPDGLPGSSLAGADAQWQGTVPGTEREAQLFAWAMQSQNAGLGRGGAVGGAWEMEGDGLSLEGSGYRVDEAFMPALGYLQEAGVQVVDSRTGWQWRDGAGRVWQAGAFAGARERLDGSEDSAFLGPHVQLESPQGDFGQLEWGIARERIAEPFEVLPGVTVPAGSHAMQDVRLEVGLAASRPYSADVSLRWGGYYGGTIRHTGLALYWRPSAHWFVKGSAHRQDVAIGAERFVAHTRALNAVWAPDGQTAHSVVWAWDNVSQTHSLGLRSRWQPGADWEASVALDRIWPAPLGLPALRAMAKLTWFWSV